MDLKKLMFGFFSFMLATTLVASSCSASINSNEEIIANAKDKYIEGGYNYTSYMQDYTPLGDYLNFSKKNFEQNDRLHFDKNGVPLVNYYGKYYYNPVTASNLALSQYGKFVKTNNVANKQYFLRLADSLLVMQSKDGAFRYQFMFKKPELGVIYQKGWVSGMAQGISLSVFSRAYALTHNVKYLNAGKKALQFLQVPKSKGGPKTDLGDISAKLSNHIWFEEYITKKNNYTLNGYMFILFGLYDWSKVDNTTDYGQRQASALFSEGILSLKEVLRKYDLGGFTMYDLSYYTMKVQPHMVAGYHAIHIYQLHALYFVTKNTYLNNTSVKWASYVAK